MVKFFQSPFISWIQLIYIYAYKFLEKRKLANKQRDDAWEGVIAEK